MRIYSSDEDLTAMANDVEYLEFNITEDEHALFTERQREGSLINVTLFPNGRSFRVRLCLGGKKQILGITKRGVAAAKFADMARLLFWNFRLRNVRPPEDQDFNFSLADAQHSLEHNDVAVRLLERMRDHLIRTGELKVTTKQSVDERNGIRIEKETRRTVRGELTRFLAENLADQVNTAAQLKTMQEVLTTVQQNNAQDYAQIKQAFHHVVESLDTLNRQNGELRLAVSRIEQRLTKDELPPRAYWSADSADRIAKLSPEAAVSRDATFGSHLNDVGTEGTDGLFSAHPDDTNTKL